MVTNIPRLELLAGVTSGGDKEKGDVGIATLARSGSSSLPLPSASLLPKAGTGEGEMVPTSSAAGPVVVSVPVALAQPVFFNSQTISGLYRCPASDPPGCHTPVHTPGCHPYSGLAADTARNPPLRPPQSQHASLRAADTHLLGDRSGQSLVSSPRS